MGTVLRKEGGRDGARRAVSLRVIEVAPLPAVTQGRRAHHQCAVPVG